jgi:NitT/TauT family transport system permease protein
VRYTVEAVKSQPRPGWRDALLFVLVFAVLHMALQAVLGMTAPYQSGQTLDIDLSPAALPGYAARSLLRMYLAFAASIGFTLAIGRVAAYNRAAERLIVPLLDIGQSIPVLGFLSITVTGFMALFPGSILGLECASIFAIFTGQVWNMTFSFYQSLKTMPRDLVEASNVFQLSKWQRFTRLELPFAMIGLVWNGMMSFGGGWFFLAASEAITVLNHAYKLPGVGSYMATAVEQGDRGAIGWAILTMIILVVLVDQFFWRPVVAWAQKFKFEQSESSTAPTSWLLDLLRESSVSVWCYDRVLAPVGSRLDAWFNQSESAVQGLPGTRYLGWAVAVAAILALGHGFHPAELAVGPGEVVHVVYLGVLTLLRVAVMLVVSTVIWTPIGVRIGFSPRLARLAQPLVQIGASFPANLTFPLLVLVFLRCHIDLNWGSILLLAMGTQWYVLFNVIAGASALPSDLKEAAAVFGLRGWARWSRFILPGIFPAWVTGALTASGGAWNASIVAEVASWGQQSLQADGLGAYIAQATEVGNWPDIMLGITVMSAFVVLLNRFVWKPLYRRAEERYALL